MDNSLEMFFNPRKVAIIGASARPGSLGYMITKNMAMRFKGEIYPVNPKYQSVAGLRCYPSIQDIPGKVDLAIIAVSAKVAVPIAEQSAKSGVKAAIIISGGFSEIGGEGIERERKLREIIHKYRIKVIGPNCVGIYDTNTGMDTIFLPEIKCNRPKKGKISFVTQSGAFAAAVLDLLSLLDLGISRTISYGNAIDVNETDLIDFLKDDEETDVITMYIEQVKSGRRFLKIAREASMKKPIVAVKAGRTRRGVAAVRSHTGSLAGSDSVYNAAFKQAGIIRANNFQEMFDMAKALSMQPPAKGNRILIVTNGGGAGVMAVDECERTGLKVPELSESLQQKLREKFPEHCITHNPVDLTGDTDNERYDLAFRIAGMSDEVDGIVANVLFQVPLMTLEIVDVVSDFSKEYDKPIVCCVWGGRIAQALARELDKSGVPTYPTPERAVDAMWALVKYGEYRYGTQ